MAELYERQGGEFRVNATTTSDQQSSKITPLSDGGFVISWMCPDQSGYDIYAQRFAADGSMVGGEFRINTTTPSSQRDPAIVGLSDGGFVVTWTSFGQDGSGYGIYAQRYAADGSTSGGEFLVNATTPGDQLEPSIAALADGGYLIAWTSLTKVASDSIVGWSIHAQRYAADGSRSGGEFLVNTSTFNIVETPAIAALPDGGFVVSWTYGNDGSNSGIYAQRYAADGSTSGGEFLVNTTTTAIQRDPAIAALSDGGFVVSWVSSLADGGFTGVYAQRYAADGSAVGAEFLVNSTTVDDQELPSVAALPDGGFLVAWQSMGQDGSNYGIYAQRYAADGSKSGGEFLVNTETWSIQRESTVAALADGTLVVSWMSLYQDGSGWGIYAQRFTADVDGITDLQLSNLTVGETAIEELPVATLSDNGSSNGAVTYQIVFDSTDGAFRLDGDQLVVADNARLDFEIAPAVTLRIRATDENGKSYEETFLLAVSDAADETRLKAGPEFRVNATTGHAQYTPSIVPLLDDGFIVSWRSLNDAIYAQRYASDGSRLGSEFLVVDTNTGRDAVGVALADGGFVFSWYAAEQYGGPSGIFAQRYAADGSKAGGAFLVNTTTTGDQMSPSISSRSDGGFVISWMSLHQDGSGWGVYAQRYGPDGTLVGGEFRVNTTALKDQMYPVIAGLSDGGFVVSWMSFGQDGSGQGIYAQRYGVDGSALGGEFLLNTTTVSDQQSPTLTALPDGGFVVSWESFGQDGSGWGIYAQRYTSDGSKSGGEFLVNSTTVGDQRNPMVAALANGEFVVSWMSANRDGDNWEVFAQRYAADGTRIGGELQVNATIRGNQFFPTVAGLLNGGFIVSWETFTQADGIYARTYTAANTAVAENDAVATNESAALAGSVFADNGSGGDRDQANAPLVVASVNGQAAAVGKQVALPSGALLTLHADGTFSYDPNGAFDHLPGPDSGASNKSAVDSFTYTLQGGETATVSVTVNGLSSGADRLDGSEAADTLTGGPGADTLTGMGGDDVLMLHQGGDDVAEGNDGNDGFYFGAALTAADDVDGGAGSNDQLGLQGDYAGFVFGAGNLVGIEMLVLLSGSDARFGDTAGNHYGYDLATVDANVGAGQRLIVSFNMLLAGENVTFDGSAETDGSFLTYGGLGDDHVTGGQQDDGFFFGTGRFGAGDRVDGQGGSLDQLGLQGDYAGANAIVFGADQLAGIEMIVLLTASDARFGGDPNAAYSYDLTMHDGNVGTGQLLTISANTLLATETLTFDGSAETDGRFTVYGGLGDDTIAGGAGDDQLWGRGGADVLAGGAGADRFGYTATADSTAAARDAILDFAAGDLIDLSRIDAIAGGSDDAFAFVGAAAFSNTAGELRATQSGADWLVEADVDGDGIADLSILVTRTDAEPMVAADFVL